MDEEEIEDLFTDFEEFYGIPVDKTKIIIEEIRIGDYLSTTRKYSGFKDQVPFSLVETTVVLDARLKDIHDLQKQLKKALEKEDYLKVQEIKKILKENHNIE